MVLITNAQLRQDYIKLRLSLSKEYIEKYSEQICKRIQQLPEYRHAKRVAIYYAANGEVNITSLIQSSLLHGKELFMPVCKAGSLIFLPINSQTHYQPNRYNILEPVVEPSLAIEPTLLDIIFLPLVAFDPFGVRVGMGKGYYDRALSKVDDVLLRQNTPYLFGVAYELQKQLVLVKKPQDVLLHGTITELNTYRIMNKRT